MTLTPRKMLRCSLDFTSSL
uniref:Uncharacterized protein n=1 Tax=Anguilla anguilla TaxID=7936 RepID=A0A0E9R4K0_ANGAN